MKPHIFLSYPGMWRCDGLGYRAAGVTPREAYWNWELKYSSAQYVGRIG